MEPERKIEKLLRAYAKKRRADAGDPLELHPATRRLLQGEVARRAKKPDEEETSMTLWELFRQRWALLAGFALIIFFGAALFLPALSKAKFKAQTLSAMNNLKQVGVAAQLAADENHGRLPASLDALTNELVSAKVLTDPQTGESFIYTAGGENLDGLSSNAVLAYSLADKKGHAVLFADGRVEVVNGDRLSELTNRRLPELAFAKDSTRRQFAETATTTTSAGGNAAAAPPISVQTKSETDQSRAKLADLGAVASSAGMLAANESAAASPSLDRPVKTPGAAGSDYKAQTGSVQFASNVSQNFNSGAQNYFKNTITPARAAVLANFQVQQNGSAIRVVDADGSVYDGSLQPEGAVGQNGLLPAETPAKTVQEKMIARRDELQASQRYFFRVSGMNQTLKQNVVLNGSLLANSTFTSNLQQSAGGSIGGRLQPVPTNQLPWSDSRIAGTAVVAVTNTIEINAVPLSH